MKVTVDQDDITNHISSITDHEFSGTIEWNPPEIPALPQIFGIGLVVGSSGSGKSTILKRFGAEESVAWNPSKSIASHFPSAESAMSAFASVGLNSVPTWLKPYHVLSNGEAYRADLARRLKSRAVVDEFTSVVDRSAASAMCRSVSRHIRANELEGIVFASCHRDIIDWLDPDWVFDTDTGLMSHRGSERRKTIELEVVPCATEAWRMFRDHHYLDGNINKSAKCWIAIWDGVPVGFAAAIAFPNGNFKKAYRGHRTVILPDYQGLGLGSRLSDAVGQMFIESGFRYFSKTAHPRLGEYRDSSPKWRATSKNRKRRQDYTGSTKTKEDGHKMRHKDRLCYSHEYIGVLYYPYPSR